MIKKDKPQQIRSIKNFTIADKRQYCIKWEKSSSSKPDFCKKVGVSKSAFYAWYKQFKEGLLNEPIFSPITIKAEPILDKQEGVQVEIRLPNQAQLLVTIQKPGLISFIQELCHATAIIR